MPKRLDFETICAEVNLDKIAHNFHETRRIVRNKSMIMAVVKDDAYGHGMDRVALELLKNGADRLAVANLNEAVQLRKLGYNVPLQVLGHTFTEKAGKILDFDIIQTVFNMELAVALSSEAIKRRKKAKIHIKLNTGMNRVGVFPDEESIRNIMEIVRMPGIELEGIMTHFASADESDATYTYIQFERFMDFCSMLKRAGISIPIRHVCNSAATLRFPEMHLEMVRPGIMLYGSNPLSFSGGPSFTLKVAMSLKTRVVQVNCLPVGMSIGYGRTFTTQRRSRIATLSAGYGDGYSRLLSNLGKVLIHGEIAPIVGTICMDQCMVDVTDIGKNITVGDEAVLFGEQGENEISVGMVAAARGSISYEVFCNIGRRVPRIYIRDTIH